MRKTITTVALSLALVCSPLAFVGTANAAATDTALAACYTLQKQPNGTWKLVQTNVGCTSSSTGTSGSSGGSSGGTSGTSTPGTYTNNCVPASSCTGSATGTGGSSR